MDKIELLGGACFSHGPYTFYKAVRIGNGRVLRLGSFFLTKLWTDADLVSIGELQLLWLDSRGSNQPLASLRLYFLPENTPEGRRNTHGEDEVLTISEKVVVRVHDLVTWLSPSVEWSWGREVSLPQSPKSSSLDNNSSQKHDGTYPHVLTDPGIDFTDVDKQEKEYETNLGTTNVQNDETTTTTTTTTTATTTTTTAATTTDSATTATGSTTTTTTGTTNKSQTRVVVLSYPRYCRYRALLRRLEGAEPSWLCSSVAAALGGFTALPGTRVLFCRDTFDYPDLETHELLCNHLAPKLKGRPRRKRKKRSVSPDESSNESETSVVSTSRNATTNISLVPALRPLPSGVRRSERNTSGDEKKFLTDVHDFMSSRGTPIGKMPLLGYRQIDLFLFYKTVQKVGGYDSVSAGRLWKSIYDDIGGNVGSTSAATITRRHYERLLLPYERHQKGEETKVRPTHGRRMKSGSLSDESTETKPEITRVCKSETPPPLESPTVPSPVPPLPSILSSSPFLTGDKPKTESGKTSSLRSVRVKPERLKSLNTIIANSTPVVNQNSQTTSPSPPPSSNTSNTSMSNTPSSTPSTTPTSSTGGIDNAVDSGVVIVGQSVLEHQLNSPLISQQVSPTSPSPPGLPVSAVTTNPTTVVTLTPPPEKDMKELKLEQKSATLLAQGKENIPLFDETPLFAEKALVPPKSPEVIDLEMENDTSRDKIVIPSFKKRKLEILREGGLEVTAVDLDARPSVIQATIIPVTATTPYAGKIDDKTNQSFSVPTTPNSVPKLISVTVTPDIGHMLQSPKEQQQQQQQQTVNCNNNSHQQSQQHTRLSTPAKPTANNHNHHPPIHQIMNNNNNNSAAINNNNSSSNNTINSRVINVGSPNNASLLQLYANAASAIQPTASTSPPASNHRFVPPASTNERLAPPKVMQSRSIFAHSEKMVYGNPKDILIPQKYHHPMTQQQQQPQHLPPPHSNTSSGILDLTQKQTDRSFARPNLEIVRVPVVPRPNPLNLDMKNTSSRDKKQQLESPSRKATFPGYSGMLDSRTMASNNLEITLVSPKNRGQHPAAPVQVHQPSPSPPSARLQTSINSGNSNNNINNSNNNTNSGIMTNNVNNTLTSQQTQRRHQNGKYPSRCEPVSPYVSRKPSHPPIIPNVPNLHHLNNPAYASSRTSGMKQQQQQQQQQQQIFSDKRKVTNDSISRDHTNNHRRISESEKSPIIAQQQQMQQHKVINTSQRQTSDSSRRHSVPASLPPVSGFVPTMQQNTSPAFLSQLPNTASKFLPMFDPLYYSAFYNGLFPPPTPPSGTPYIPPEFSAYYKELLASSQPRLAMTGQHQPAVPTSK